jgi:membrane-bound lytic murein transglycosylase F
VKYGYARGWEPVLYVNNIRNYYNILRWITANEDREGVEGPEGIEGGAGEPDQEPVDQRLIEIARSE